MLVCRVVLALRGQLVQQDQAEWRDLPELLGQRGQLVHLV